MSTDTAAKQVSELSPIKLALAARRLRNGGQLALLQREPIAIVGMGCRFPDAPTPEDYWELLANGRDAVRPVPADRWDVDELDERQPEAPGSRPCRSGAFLDDVRGFDAAFFRVSPREAALLDPQQRLWLEVAWEALERAGLAHERLASSRTGVFVGLASSDYAHRQVSAGGDTALDPHFGTGSAPAFVAGRLSYFLGVRGPSLTVDTACSSSLVALHLACASLRGGDCDLAIAGGVHLMLSAGSHLYLSGLGALAPDGRSKAFDAAADGFGRGEGCGVVVLKRLADAVADGDPILALVRGSAVNHDGASGGLTVPNASAQEAVIREALERAGVQPAAVGYVEAHGTGTLLGDPIEIRALGAVFAGRPRDAALLVGAAKANVGHLEAAAGMAGLIKVVLCAQHGELPPQPHFNQPNPHVAWDELAIEVPRERRPWPSAPGAARVAGISAFGMSGTNAHVLLESAPESPVALRAPAPLQLLPVSARSPQALRTLAGRLRDHLDGGAGAEARDVCFTAAAGRRHFRWRAAVTGASPEELRDALAQVAVGQQRKPAPHQSPRVALLFAGQGSEVGAGTLYETQPAFRAALDRCAALLAPWLDDPLAILRNAGATRPEQTSIAPLRVALEWSLAQLWRSWGVTPDAVLGRGVGQYTAACVAGALSIDELLARLRAADSLPAEPASAKAAAALNDLTSERLRVPLVSSLTGELINSGQLLTPDHWVDHRNQPAPIADGLMALYDLGYRVFLELGADPAAGTLERDSLPADALLLPSPAAGQAGLETTLATLGQLYCAGAAIDWDAVHAGSGARRTILPTYPFERSPHWFEQEPAPIADDARADRPDAAAPPAAARPMPASDSASPAMPATSAVAASVEQVLEQLRADLAAALREEPSAIDRDTPFVELGVDSVILIEALRDIEARYGVRVSLRRLFEDLGNLTTLSAHLVAERSHATRSPPAGDGHGLRPASEGPHATLLPLTAPTPSVIPAAVGPLERRRPAQDVPASAREAAAVQSHAAVLAGRYNARTATSKLLVADQRRYLADSRAAAGFRPSTKELLYPIVGERSEGAYLHDVDGNRYVDISMDFGANLFGHSPAFLRRALHEQLDRGNELAPRPRLAGEVAALLRELTGMERVVFCQSGSEAVMTALRLARVRTGRNRVALFRNAYHGHTDGVLGTVVEAGGERQTVAAAPGIPPNVADNLVVLEYGEDSALQEIRRCAGDLAAVLVEPVQSRRPDLQPREFLQGLRALTQELEIVLVFDEMLTGFRPCRGGAQEWFGVKADLATYGKVIGGGLPVAVVAGRHELIDGIDGGYWSYGDDSLPSAETTFFAGTFNCYPLAMASARAVLTELRAQSPQLQQRLNDLTGRLAGTLDGWLREREVPLRIVHFGSQFRFAGARHLDLLMFHLLERGVFVWEGRNCFLSAAHSDADVDHVIDAVQGSVEELRAAGLFGGRRLVATTRSTRADTIALSEAQRQLWLLSELEGEAAVAYAEPLVLELEGPIERDVLAQALAHTVRRHEALRTTIEAGGERQRVHEQMRVVLEHADLRGVDADRDGWLQGFVARPFQLQHGPLIRAALVDLGDEHALLAVVAHHIVVDGWSLGIVLRDLTFAYAAILDGRDPQGLAPAQFRDFLLAEAERVTASPTAAHVAYWTQALHDAPAPLELPTDSPADGRRTWRGERQHRRLDAQARGRLEQFGRGQGATLFVTLLAALAGFLHRVTASEDLVIGAPVLGRGPGRDVELDLVGYCTHLLPIRSRSQRGEPFAALLQRLRGTTLDAFDHQDLPYAHLLRALNLSWAQDRPPLVSVIFNLDRPPQAPRFPGVRARIVPAPAAAVKLGLAINVTDTGGDLLLDLDGSADLLDGDELAEMADRFVQWLQLLADGPDAPLAALPIGVTADLKPSPVPVGGASLQAMIHAHAARDPDADALVGPGGQRVSYGELARRGDRVATALSALGVAPQELVAIVETEPLATVVAQLGVLSAGAAFAPHEVADRSVDVDELCGSAAAATTGTVHRSVPSAAIACVAQTSATAGSPHCVAITHAGLTRLARWSADALGFAPGERVVPGSGGWEALAVLAAGGCVVLADRPRDPHQLARLLHDEHVTQILGTPLEHQQLLAVLQTPPSSLTAVHVAGERFAASLHARIRRALGAVRITNLYGTAEAGLVAAFHDAGPPDSPTVATVPIGRPAAGARLYVLDRELRPVPRGTPGMLFVGGPGVAPGYLRAAAETAAELVPDPLAAEPGARMHRTGDLVRQRRDGTLEWLAHEHSPMQPIGGLRESGLVEAALLRHPEVCDAALMPGTQSAGDVSLDAYVVPVVRDAELAQALLEYLRGTVPAHMVPNSVTLLESFPATPRCRIDRRALPSPEPPHSNANGAARTAVEQAVADRFAQLLGVDQVQLADNFFALGGHSLQISQLAAWARREFAIELPLRLVLEGPTVARLARAIEAAPRAVPETEVTPAPREAHRFARSQVVALTGSNGSDA